MLLPAIRTWAEWGSMFTDVARWTPAVRAICRQVDLPVREIKAGYPGTNAVFVLDGAYVLKIYAPFCHRDFDLERELYPLLAQIPDFPVPHVVAQGVLVDRIRWPYIVMTYLPGEPIREVRGQIPRDNLLEIMTCLGNFVRVLHAAPLTQITSLDTSLEGWQRFVQRQKVRAVERNRRHGVLPLSILKAIPRFITTALQASPAGPLCLMNGDLTEDHVLLVRQDGRWHISGLIDFADSLIGRSDYEWAALWFSALDRDREALHYFMQGYDANLVLDAAFVQRAMAFTFLHEFSAEIITGTLEALGDPTFTSMGDLQAKLWWR